MEFKELCVDSGCLCLASIDKILELGGYIPQGAEVVKCEKGKRSFTYTVSDKEGFVGQGELNVESVGDKGLYVGDLCYCFNAESWAKLLDSTDYLVKKLCWYSHINTYGDGVFILCLAGEKE